MRHLCFLIPFLALQVAVPLPAAAFEMAQCDTILRHERVAEGAGPTGPVDFHIEPGFTGQPVTCRIEYVRDPGWQLQVFEQVPDERPLTLMYLEDQMLLLNGAVTHDNRRYLAGCAADSDATIETTCFALLAEGSTDLVFVETYDADRTLTHQALQVDMVGLLTDTFTTETPPFLAAPQPDRAVTLQLPAANLSFDLVVGQTSDRYEVTGLDHLVQLTEALPSTGSVEWRVDYSWPGEDGTRQQAGFVWTDPRPGEILSLFQLTRGLALEVMRRSGQ